jgi:hypothetical protein
VSIRPARNHYRAYFCSTPLRRWLARMGLGFDMAPDKRTPPLLFQAAANVRAAFLRGLFDTDGSVGKINVRYTTSSFALAREVHTMLLSLGVISRLYSQGPRHHKVAVSGTALPRFLDRVGFVVSRKRLALEGLVDRGRGRVGKTNLDIIPFGPRLLQEYAREVPRARGVRGQGPYANRDRRFQIVSLVSHGRTRLSYNHLERLARHAEGAGQDLPQVFKESRQTNYFYDPIVSVERLTTETMMFDLEVANHHSFTVNGFVCHNSQGSEYPAVVLPLHTQHFKMLQRNLLYTGITRGKRLVVVVGSRQALELAVRNQDTSRRYSMLADRLRKAAESSAEPGH